MFVQCRSLDLQKLKGLGQDRRNTCLVHEDGGRLQLPPQCNSQSDHDVDDCGCSFTEL